MSKCKHKWTKWYIERIRIKETTHERICLKCGETETKIEDRKTGKFTYIK